MKLCMGRYQKHLYRFKDGFAVCHRCFTTVTASGVTDTGWEWKEDDDE
jgi:hypothetical protein